VDELVGRRVLILARSPFEAPFLARRLGEVGATVVLVESPTEALAALAQRSCDLLIADCALGSDVVRAVAQEARASGVERCLVLLSPFDRRGFGPPTAAGFDGYLVKPVRPRSLFERLVGPRPAEAAVQPQEESRAAPAASERRGTAARVLLAEDNEINALLALKCLERLCAAIDWAKDGREALALAEASLRGERPAYDLVLMDIRMPGLDGLEATRLIRQHERSLGCPRRMRIVALTANALREDEAAARAAGLDGFLAKPFELKALTALIAPGQSALARAS
jgi:CheY-like chemotaxis protein